ncbi:hypothetical protein [Tsukamurella soli]|uniref:CRISPR-associated protein Csb3 n=1 Tax=Tsukamurella soli TaxID=644556 RepID=A0ABP8KEZ3_9ACTN
MNTFTLDSNHTRALDHFAGYGLSAILEDSGEDVRMHWSDAARPRLVLDGLTSDETTVAEIVRNHALSHGTLESWVQRTTTIRGQTKSSEVGLFSPRIATPGDPTAWMALFTERRAVLDAPMNDTRLDARMIQSLGEPAYWPVGTQLPEPDRGASRWEMKTRNRGEDFMRNRLAPLARAVAKRDSTAIQSGLTGQTITDEVGKNSIESRSATGLALPGPVDNALAWCALWGLSFFPVTHLIGKQSFTPGAYPQDRIQPQQMTLPITTTPISPAKLRRVLRSRALNDAAYAESSSPERAVGQEALRRVGLAGLVRFPVRIAGSASAPERQVLFGTFESL